MIEIFQGRIGGGKTYSAVLRIAAHLGKGGHVFSNIEVNPLGLAKLVRSWYRVEPVLDAQYHMLERDQIPIFHKFLSAGSADLPNLVVIDEAQLFFNARDWQKASAGLLTFLTQSRKVRCDVILITQNMSLIDKQLRVNSQFVWAFKDFKRFISWFPFPLILAVCFDVDATTKIGMKWVWKKKIVFDAYNSYALLRPIEFGSGSTSRLQLRSSRRRVSPFWYRRFLVRHRPFVATLSFVGLIVILIRIIFLIR